MGAPGSGKSALAQQLCDPIKEKYGSTQIVDNYIETIENRSDVMMSQWASYLGNLQVAIGRFEHERFAASNGAKNIITCGTIVETIVHNAVLSHMANEPIADDDPMKFQNYLRTSMSMEFLGLIFKDTWNYDVALYLPLLDTEEDSWPDSLDKSILFCCKELKVEYEALDGPIEGRKDMALKLITEKVDDKEVAASNG